MSSAAKRYFDRGLAALQGNDAASAAQAFSAALELAPSYAPTSQWLMVAHARAGAPATAVAIGHQALARSPSARDALWLWILLAEAMLAAGRPRDAQAAYGQAEALLAHVVGQPDARRRVALGQARMAAGQGQWDRALAALLAHRD